MENAVEIVNLGKMYRLFDKQSDRIQDIFGLDKLRFCDREPRYREFWALLNIGTGFHPEFTGIENIRTALAYAGMDSKKIKSCMDEIIEFSEVEDYIHQPVK